MDVDVDEVVIKNFKEKRKWKEGEEGGEKWWRMVPPLRFDRSDDYS